MELSVWQASDSIEVTFASDSSVFDGRFANSGWLQELPDPMTKLTWDNAALMAPSTASALGLTTGSMAKFAIDDRSIDMAVYVMPGHAQGCATLPMGYGRTDAGHVAGLVADRVTPTGFNVFPLRGSEALGFSLASIQGTGETYTLVSTQDHHIIDEIGMEGRADRLGDLIRGGDLDEWEQQPDFAQHVVHHPPL
jgi:molybdopterin-containing oxidoreductase family iron-sulfur binding subunit